MAHCYQKITLQHQLPDNWRSQVSSIHSSEEGNPFGIPRESTVIINDTQQSDEIKKEDDNETVDVGTPIQQTATAEIEAAELSVPHSSSDKSNKSTLPSYVNEGSADWGASPEARDTRLTTWADANDEDTGAGVALSSSSDGDNPETVQSCG